jgi:electron transfer flavoprotein alpha subunit
VTVLVFVEHDGETSLSTSLQAVTLGRTLAGTTGSSLLATLVGDPSDQTLDLLGAHGVDAVHAVRDERVSAYAPAAWAASVAHVGDAEGAAAILAAATDRGNEVLAHVGARTGRPLAANCTEVRPVDPLEVTRLRWGGSLTEEARMAGSPALLTVALHAVAAEPAAGSGRPDVRDVVPDLTDEDLRVRLARVEPSEDRISLSDARVVVGGGRGVGSAEGFEVLEELADLLGGTVGVTRAVTSLGWRPHALQVGQTGTKIAPEIYIACGISGAIQHIVGCKGAKRILAINTDPDAPIMSRADHAVIGDLHQVVPAVVAELRRSS